MFERILTRSRYMIVIAVIGSLIASLTLILYGGLEVVYILVDAVKGISIDAKVDKSLILTFIEVIDLFLLGTAFYIIALGLYELFINDRIDLPAWLVIHDFDDLKGKLISVLVVVLGVLFLGQVANWKGGTDLISYGVTIALVIASLAYFQSHKAKKEIISSPDDRTEGH
jgi:uncharacterized membrane protein YqhA